MSGDCQFTQIPEVFFLVNYGGITVFSARMTNPKLVPFDICGRCRSCKSDNVTIDYAIQAEGVTVMTDRMKKPKFVPFDVVLPFKNECFFRVKTQSRSIDIPFRVTQSTSPTPMSDAGAQFTLIDSDKQHQQQLQQQYSVPSDLVVDTRPCTHHDVTNVAETGKTTQQKLDGGEEFMEVVLDTNPQSTNPVSDVKDSDATVV